MFTDDERKQVAAAFGLSGWHFVTWDPATGTWKANEPEAKPASASAPTPELRCPLPGCGKANDAGVRVCWCCGNELKGK